MAGARTYIADKSRPASGDFVLNVQIPVEHVRAVWVWVNHAITNLLPVEIEIRVRCACPQSGRRIGSNDLKRRSGGGIQTELIGQRKHIENAESSADRGFTILPRVPGNTDARFEIFGRGVV